MLFWNHANGWPSVHQVVELGRPRDSLFAPGFAAELLGKQFCVISPILFGLVLIGLRVGWQFLEWLSRVYVLTDARVLRVMGVLRVQVFEAPLKQIQHTDTVFSLRERFLGLGSIAFSTAGTGSIDAVWRMVAQPLDVHQRVVHALNRYR